MTTESESDKNKGIKTTQAYDKHRGRVDRYLRDIRRNVSIYHMVRMMMLTQCFIDVAFYCRACGTTGRCPELADYVGLVQVKIDNVDNR